MTTQTLLSSWNLIFELPFALGLLYLFFYTLSGWTFGEAEPDPGFDHDMDIDSDVTLDHDSDLSHDAHDLHADADTDADSNASTHATQPAAFLSALNWVGIGRMPLSLVLMILMLCWGTLGFAANQLQHDQPVDRSTTIAIAVAAVGSVCITHLVSTLLGPVFTATTVSPRRHDLLGSFGEALYPIDEKFGMVCGRDDRGEHFQVACRIEDGKAPVAKGAPVQLVAYTAKERMFFVVPAHSSLTPRRGVGMETRG